MRWHPSALAWARSAVSFTQDDKMIICTGFSGPDPAAFAL